jgi:hypothetical protein
MKTTTTRGFKNKKDGTWIEFNEAELKLIQGCVADVWNEVAYDLLTSIAEEKGKSVNSVTVSRSLVIEICLDAGRPEEIFKERTRSWTTEDRANLFARWEALDYTQRISFVKPAFPYRTYGM